MKAREVMTSPVLCLPADTPIRAAVESLSDHGFTAAPVTDENRKPVGIITPDLLTRGHTGHPRPMTRWPTRADPPALVRDVMTPSIVSLTPGADISDVVEMMLQLHIGWIPIVDGYAVVGIITPADLFGVDHPQTTPQT